uniref:Uncharacterized protein n=1 Tax=Chenopodium quinoa TaxID=63459 RepID=A0A803N580_CHEQI
MISYYCYQNALKDQAERGEIIFENRHDDILARALKKVERGGNVRGVGSGITKKQYFGSAKPTPPSQLHNELNCVRSEVAMLKNQNNVIMSYLLSGQNIGEFKQLMASGISGQSSVPIGQDNGSGNLIVLVLSKKMLPKLLVHLNLDQIQDFLPSFYVEVLIKVAKVLYFSQGNPYTRSQDFQETEYNRPHSEKQEHELEPYQVSWPDTTNANSPQQGNSTEDDKEIQIIAIGQVYISGSTLVINNQLKDKENTPISRLPSTEASSKKPYNITNKDRAMVTSCLLEAFKKEAMGLRQRNGNIILNIPFNVFYNEMVIRLDYEDIFDWCFQREVGASHMSIFMMYLSEECQKEGISGLYGFCDVNFISPLTPTKEGVMRNGEL